MPARSRTWVEAVLIGLSYWVKLWWLKERTSKCEPKDSYPKPPGDDRKVGDDSSGMTSGIFRKEQTKEWHRWHHITNKNKSNRKTDVQFSLWGNDGDIRGTGSEPSCLHPHDVQSPLHSSNIIWGNSPQTQLLHSPAVFKTHRHIPSSLFLFGSLCLCSHFRSVCSLASYVPDIGISKALLPLYQM